MMIRPPPKYTFFGVRHDGLEKNALLQYMYTLHTYLSNTRRLYIQYLAHDIYIRDDMNLRQTDIFASTNTNAIYRAKVLTTSLYSEFFNLRRFIKTIYDSKKSKDITFIKVYELDSGYINNMNTIIDLIRSYREYIGKILANSIKA